MVKLVIGVAGTIGSGKDTIADYLIKNYNFQKIVMGDLVREEAKELGLELTRENLQDLGKKRTQEHGMDYWGKKTANRIIQMNIDFVVISGMRRELDILVPKQIFGDKFKSIFVDADLKIRFERLKKRARFGDPETFEEFEKQEKGEWEQFDYNKTKEICDFVISNNVNLDEFYKKLDDLMKQIGI